MLGIRFTEMHPSKVKKTIEQTSALVQASPSLYKRLIEKSKPAGVHRLYQKHQIFELKKLLTKRWPISVQDAVRIG